MRLLLLVPIVLSACTAQQASQQPEMSIQPARAKAEAEAPPRPEESCLPSPSLLALAQCVAK